MGWKWEVEHLQITTKTFLNFFGKKKLKIHRIQGISLDILKDNNAKVHHSQTAENKFKKTILKPSADQRQL